MTASAIVSTTFAGLDGLYVGFKDTNNMFNGFSALTAAGSSGMRKIKGVQKVPSALPQPNRKYIKGDDRIIDQFMFAADSLPGGTIEVGTNDLTLDAAVQNSTTYTLGNWLMGIYGISNPTFPSMMLLGHQQAHSQDSASVGATGFNNILWPNVQMLPLGEDDPSFQNEGKNMYGCTFMPFAVAPWGADLDTSNFSVEDGIKIKWWSQYRTFMFAIVGDGTQTTFVVDHTPVNVASTKVFGFNLDGSGSVAAVTVSSLVTSTKTITVGSALLTTKLYVCLYEASKI